MHAWILALITDELNLCIRRRECIVIDEVIRLLIDCVIVAGSVTLDRW